MTGIVGIEPTPTVLETVVLPLNYIPMVEGSGFEPPNPKERIYSPPRLARLRYPSIMARDGIEPPTHGASIHCSTDWATEPLTYIIIWYKRSMTDLNRRSSPWQGDEITTTPMDLLNKEDKRFELLRGLTHLTVFKTVPFSQTWVILHKYGWRDLNPHVIRH